MSRLFSSILFSGILVSGAFGQTWGPPPHAQPDYSIIYTGKLFGYFRYPDVQASTDRGCPDLGNTPLPPQVELFQRTLAQMHSDKQELVAMGENFAPELLARTVRNKTPGTAHYRQMISKDVLADREGHISSDNVGCFLRLMGFNAVVPGQQDFYYGPEHLREIARFLARSGNAVYQPVQMLAANLVIRSVVRNQTPRLPDGELPGRMREALESDSAIAFDLPSTVLPWLKDVGVQGDASRISVDDCPANPDNPKEFDLPSDKGSRCRALPAEPDAPLRFRFHLPAEPSQNFLPAYESLDPGSNHALCISYLKKGEQKVHCQLFSVQYPFFQYRPNDWGPTPTPYFVPSDTNGAVIFGALDPSLVGYIGQLSDVWKNADERFDTSAQITDPLEALRQLLSLCNSDANCRGRHKILLAQMPYYKASQLASKLKVFDIVIAQPDQEHATGNENTSLEESQGTPQLLTPGIAFDTNRENALSTNLRRADYYAEGDVKRFLANRVYDSSVPHRSEEPCLTCALNAEVAHAAAQPADKKAYEQLALKSMQEFCGSDIALLQHRDIFGGFDRAAEYWPSDFHATPQQLLDETLWKGDFAFCVPVKGSTLKKILAESAAFDKQDQDDLSIEVERGRGLSSLGIAADPRSGLPTIRGQVVDNNKLYGVAMTDYLAFGNTGYPELSTEAVQPVVRLVSLGSLNRLTGLACQDLPPSFTAGSCQSDQIPAANYFAAIRQRPFDTSRGVTAWLVFRRWATQPLQPQPNATTFLARKTKVPENVVERRGLWWFTLQNVSLGYNLNFIKGADQTLPGNFTGNNSFSQLSTPESSQLSLWARARGGYSFPRFVDFYASAEMKYARLAVRNSISNGNFGQYQLTLGTNLLRGEAGILTKPLTERFPIRLLASENLLTQATTPFQQFAAPLACGVLPCPNNVTTLTNFTLAKNYLVMTRLGARIQNDQSWFEAGREYGANVDIPYSYSLQDLARDVPLECPLAQGLSLSNCVATDALFTKSEQNHSASTDAAGGRLVCRFSHGCAAMAQQPAACSRQLRRNIRQARGRYDLQHAVLRRCHSGSEDSGLGQSYVCAPSRSLLFPE